MKHTKTSEVGLEHQTPGEEKIIVEKSVNRDSDNEHCPECDGHILKSDGEFVCSDCGLVVDEDRIDSGAEWYSTTSDDGNEKRVGAPTTKLRHDDGLTTQIDWKNKDIHGNTVNAEKRRRLSRLRKRDKRAKRKGEERRVAQAIGEIQRIGSSVNIPKNVQETASMIYQRASEEGYVKGWSIEGVSTAALYAAARQHGTARTVDEFERVARVGRESITGCYNMLNKNLSLPIPPTDPTDHIHRYTSELGIENNPERFAKTLCKLPLESDRLNGKDPSVLAGGAIYCAALVYRLNLSQAEIAEVASITTVSIRNTYDDLFKLAEENDVEVYGKDEDVSFDFDPRKESKAYEDPPSTSA